MDSGAQGYSPTACGIFLDRNWTCVPCIGRWVLNHRITREVLFFSFLKCIYWDMHAIKFAHFHYPVQDLLAFLENWATITTLSTFPSPPQESLCPFAAPSPISSYASSADLHPALGVGLCWICNRQVNAFDSVNFHCGFQSLMECLSWNRPGTVIQSKLFALQLRKLTVHCVVHEGWGSGLVAKLCLTLVWPHGL